MELLAKEKMEKAISKDNMSRRKLRQMQVRQQSNEWMDRNRKKYYEERQLQIKLITESLTQDAQEQAVRDIEILEKMHDLCAAEVGSAHRAAANLPDFELLQSQKNQENQQVARSRGAQALAQEKLAMDKHAQAIKRARILRENIRREEDERLREFVERQARITRSQGGVNKDKLSAKTEKKRRTDYQPSLAKTLRVPKESTSDTKASKSKRHSRLSRKPKDVAYIDTAVPQGSLKYPPPPGLVQKYSLNSSRNAFENAQRIASEQREKEQKQKADELEQAKEAERRGKTALKVAKLQKQLDDLKNEFLLSGFQVDPKLNDSFLGLSNSEEEEETDKANDQLGAPTPMTQQPFKDQLSPSKMTSSDSKKPKTPVSPIKGRQSDLPERDAQSKTQSKSTKSPKSEVPQGLLKAKDVPKLPQKPVPSSAVKFDRKSEIEDRSKRQGPPADANITKDSQNMPTGRISPLEKSFVTPEDVGDTSGIQKPRLISTRKSIRNQPDKLDSRTGASLPGDVKKDKFKEVDTAKKSSPSKNSQGIKPSNQVDDVPTSKVTGTSKGSIDKKKLFFDKSLLESEGQDEAESSDSLHTLPTIDSHPDVHSKQIDEQSPPDTSKEFPITSTPATDTKNSKLSSFNNTSCSQGPLSPRASRKKRKALMYYIHKLLEMRPESMNSLAATSSVSVHSCIEIPSSAVSSIISTSSATGSSSNSSVEETNNSKNSKHLSTTNGTTDHFTTLSSVTEEEEEPTSESRSYEQNSEQTSSGETLAKITVAVSPRSNSEST